MKRNDIAERKDEILEWIKENKSKAFMCQELKCKQDTLNRWLKTLGICYKGNQSGKGTEKTSSLYMPLQEYLLNSQDIQTNKIREKILKEQIKPRQCECCKLTEWLGKPIPLEVHHIDGNRNNNVLENFQLLCPNCHSLTDSYRGKNISKYKSVETI